ncbi:kinase-like domain-containing protein [Rhizophagus irregularis DAOM 181602=DAOM 197198]|nr:kinase-like domain-containing protein [Rhizophagus irregularis DAOM 181602=DAOM 197198]
MFAKHGNIKKCEKDCKLCGKLIYQKCFRKNIDFRLCSDCYKISSGWIESTMTEKTIPILYLPWWDARDQCIVYQSQCKKCERMLLITIEIKSTEKEIIFSTKINSDNHYQIVNYMDNRVETSAPLEVYSFIKNLNYHTLGPLIDWCSYSQMTNLNNLIIPIMFIPFNNNDDKCHYCNEPYSKTLLFKQKYYNIEFKLCINCYQISFECIESTLTEKAILYLPWLLNVDDEVIEEVPDDKQYAALNNNAYNQIAHFMNNINENSNQLEIYNFIARLYLPSKSLINWISYSQTSNLENNESVIVPIVFIPFDNNKDKCYYCKEPYSITPLFQQKYCRYCLFLYFKYTTNNNLDVYISTKDIQCNRHKPRSLDFCTQNIQEWCNSCSEVSYFKQVVTNCRFDGFNDIHGRQNFIDSGKYCKLCGKLIYDQISLDNIEFRLCKNCYQISSGLIESSMTEKTIPIIYLPWWNANNQCIFCDQTLELNSSNCQKWCSNCIIIYIGCRYCLTTNIIFGITNQSQCKKCQEVTLITIDIKSIEREIFVSMRINFVNHFQIVNYIDDNNDPLKVYDFIRNLDYISLKSLKPLMDWISYAQITDLENPIVPIMFIPFNNNVDECHYCKEPYSVTPLFQQKYCRYCLFLYFRYTANNNLDIYICTKDTQCNRHKPRGLDFCTQNIQEWCNSCSEVLYFKQVVTNCRFDTFNEIFFHGKQELIESEKHCKLCEKLIYNQITSNNIEFKLCTNCYQISFEWIESTITEKVIPILYLPWWDANNQCISCDQILEFNSSNCQKWCSNCILIYIGCRYCLTTNIIFGITNQSKCKKCDRILDVDSNKVIEEVPDKQYATLNNNAYNQIAHFMNNINENSNQLKIYNFIIGLYLPSKSLMDLISYSQIINLENNESVIVPIVFIPFDNSKDKCYYCKESYSVTPLFQQKYCRYCLFLYFKYTTNNNLDIYISTKDTQCNRHRPRSLDFCTQNIQEWCNSCSEVLYFKQVVTNCRFDGFNDIHGGQKFIESGKYCKLCGKLIYDQISLDIIEFKLCKNCYQISSGLIESTMTEKTIPIIYLPWWDANNQCIFCDQILKFNSDHQKWCSNCIIIYIGCRYCLTTNIIFGITNQSQCKKCDGILNVVYKAIIKEVFDNKQYATFNVNAYNQISHFMNIINENSNQLEIYNHITRLCLSSKLLMDWISYSQITNLENLIVPIMFISFNNNDDKCHYCKEPYSVTLLFKQKYCRYCLFLYFEYTANNNLDIYISTKDTQCNHRHKPRSLDFCTQNILEWCNSCSEVLCFKQVVTNFRNDRFYNIHRGQKFIESGKYCKLCKKLIYDQILSNNIEFRLCPICYQISFGFVESTLTEKFTPILYLPCGMKGVFNNMKHAIILNEITNFIENILNENTNPLIIYDSIKRMFLDFRANQSTIKEIPYSQISNLKQIAKGGFGIVYKATWMGNNVAVKRFLNSQNISKSFLNEIISFIQCYNRAYIIKVHGITQDLQTKDFMLVMEYASGGNLHNYLQGNFVNITWNKKLRILWNISEGLNIIHGKNFMHRDFHSNKPFADVEHDINLIYKIIDGKRPEITNDTPECYANLMKRCWNSDPSKRPSITEVTKVLGDWYRKNECVEQHEQAERKRLELIQLKQLGPKFSEKPHHRAIYTSRPLSFMISDPSSIFSFNLRQGNITEKLNVDIDSIDKSGSFNESSINSFNSSQGYISEDINFDIDNIDTSKSLKRSNSQNGTQGHGKRSKTDSNL